MSIAVMSDVWKYSKASHGALLVLLAIADFANDEGEAYPSVETLRKKARLTERSVQNALKELIQLDELSVLMGAGRNGTNLYTVQNLPPAKIAPPQKTTDTPAKIAPKPLRTVNKGKGAGARIPTTPPSIKIAELFHRKLVTPWSENEIKSYKKLVPVDMEELGLICDYYASERQKGGDGIHRRDLYTFLNNYHGELDRARAWKENPNANEKTPSRNGSGNRNPRAIAASSSNSGTSNAAVADQY